MRKILGELSYSLLLIKLTRKAKRNETVSVLLLSCITDLMFTLSLC